MESSFVVENAACLGAKSGSFDEMPDTSVTFYFFKVKFILNSPF